MATEHDAGESAARSLAAFVHDLEVDAIPAAAAETATRSIADTVGVALAGADEEATTIAREYVRAVESDGEATTVTGDRVAPPGAAFVDGVAAHALDFDDVTYTFPIHPSATIVPSLLAVGEAVGADGEDLVAGYVAAFEYEMRVAGGVGDDLLEAGLHPTGVVGTFGATVAAGRLLDLDARRFRDALAIAASLYAGSTGNFGTMTKPLHAGMANRHGVTAAMLAEQGFTGNHDLFDRPTGPWPAQFEGYDLEERCDDLGSRWYAADGIGIKRYPSCGCTHAAVDAGASVASRLPGGDRDPSSFASVTVHSVPAAAEVLQYDRPDTGLEGKFSMQYCVATALLDGTVALADFTDAAVEHPDRRALVERVRFESDPSLSDGAFVGGSMPARVAVELADGTTLSETVEHPSGTPENPLSEAALAGKFRDCATRTVDGDAAEALWDSLRDPTALDDVREVTAAFEDA